MTHRSAIAGQGGGAVPWWTVAGRTCHAAWQAIGAASLAASYVNLANPGAYDLAAGIAPTLNADGWVCDGTCWLRTGIVPPGTQDWTIICRFSNGSGITRSVMGCSMAGDGQKCYLYPRRNGTADNYVVGNGTAVYTGVRLAAGVLAVAGSRAYLDGEETANNIGQYTGNVPEMYLCGLNYEGQPTAPWVGSIQAAAAYPAALTAAEIAALSIRMAALVRTP